MDLSGAAVLIAVTLGLTQMVKTSFPAIPNRAVPLVAIVVGVVATVITANSDWGDSQKIGDKVLSSLNGFSLAVVAVAVAALSAAAYTGLKAVANIGQNKEDSL